MPQNSAQSDIEVKGNDSSPIRVVSLTAESREPRDSYETGSIDYDEKYQQSSYIKQEYDQKSNSSDSRTDSNEKTIEMAPPVSWRGIYKLLNRTPFKFL